VLPQWRNNKLHTSPDRALDRRRKGVRALLGYFKLRKPCGKRCPPKRCAEHLPELYRAALDVQACTGWHTTELVRWLELGGVVEPLPDGYKAKHREVAVLFTTHKRGTEHRTAVPKDALDAAIYVRDECFRIQREGATKVGFDPKTRTSKTYARRLFPKQHYERAIRRLCEKHGLEPFGPGHMRHALATYAKTRGMSNAQIAKMLGHTDGGRLVETTYADPAAQIDSPLASASGQSRGVEVAPGLPSPRRAAS